MSSYNAGRDQRRPPIRRIDLGGDEEDDLDYSETTPASSTSSSKPPRHHAGRPSPHFKRAREEDADFRRSGQFERDQRASFRDRDDQRDYRRDSDRDRAWDRHREQERDRSYDDRTYGQHYAEHRVTDTERRPHPSEPASVAHLGRGGPFEARHSSSPEPDADLEAFLKAQAESSTTSTSASDAKVAEQLKMERFQHGASKTKSRYQRDKEEAERKKKQEEEDAAKAYAEFVADMAGEQDANSSSSRSSKPKGFVAAGGKASYVGSRHEVSQSRQKPAEKRSNNAFGEDVDDDEEPTQTSPASALRKEPPIKRKRAAMDSFLSELQTQQAERESRLSAVASSSGTSISTLLAQEGLKPGSRDLNSDPLTTNICVLNLPTGIEERSMGKFFSAWGDVATVKIMWPRGEPRDRQGAFTGFVAYMTRKDAEYAFKEADGVVWGGTRIKLSWGKAMPLPSRAMYPMSLDARREQVQTSRSHLHPAPSTATATQKSEAGGGKNTLPKLVIRHRRPRKDSDAVPPAEQLKQTIEREHDTMHRLFIETVASRVRSHGPNFESILRDKESDNPRFSFLQDEDSADYQYFRYCIDPNYRPLLPAPDFSDRGEDDLYSTDSGEESEALRMTRLGIRRTGSAISGGGGRGGGGGRLGDLARKRLYAMLRGLTLRRERIARVMAFAMDHASAHLEVVEILVSSLLLPSTPIPRKLARLYALSDILHNSGTPIANAWKYRGVLESKLPLVFAHLGQIIKSFPGRMKQEGLKTQVKTVLEVWDSWLVVSPPVMERLRYLLGNPPLPPQPAPTKTAAADSYTNPDGQPTSETQARVKATAQEEEEEEEDLDGEAMDNAQEDVAVAANQEKDEEEEDLDGEAM